MSFGYSISDAFLLVQLAWKTVQNSRKACGEHDELTREVSSLHLVIRRLKKEVSRSESPINRPDDTYKEELQAIVGGCEKVLLVLNKVLEKYNTLSEKERSAKKLWQRVRFGNGELADMRDLREKLTYYTSALSLVMNMISMGSIGRVEEQMENAGGDIKEIRIAINGITAHLMSGSNREGSVLTTYADDDKAVWKEFRKELIEDGFSSSIIRKHKRLIKAYIKELGDRGLLDDEDPHDIKNLSEEDGAITDDHATPSTETEDPPKVTYKSPFKTESELSEDDLPWATGNGVETTPRVISDTGSFSDPIQTSKSFGRMEEERKNLRAYHEDEMDDRGRISRRGREAEQSAEEIKRDRRIKRRDKDRRRDVESKSRGKFVHFKESDSSDSEIDIPLPASHNSSPGPRHDPSSASPSTPAEALAIIADTFHTTFQQQAHNFIRHPPGDKKSRESEYKKLSEAILTQTIMKLDGVETEGDEGLRAKRKELVRAAQGYMIVLDQIFLRYKPI